MGKKPVDYIPWLIWAGFVLLSALALVFMYPSYQVQRHQRAAYRLLKAGQSEKAIPELETLVRLKPDAAQWPMKLGQAYLDSDPMEPGKALEQFHAALELDPSLDLALELGICWSELGDTGKAEAHFKEGLMPETPGALASEPAVNYHLGREAFKAGDYQQAARYFQAAAADPRWDARSESYRREIARRLLSNHPPEKS